MTSILSSSQATSWLTSVPALSTSMLSDPQLTSILRTSTTEITSQPTDVIPNAQAGSPMSSIVIGAAAAGTLFRQRRKKAAQSNASMHYDEVMMQSPNNLTDYVSSTVFDHFSYSALTWRSIPSTTQIPEHFTFHTRELARR